MLPSLAAFLDEMPNWSKIVIGSVTSFALVVIALKPIIPHFFHEVPPDHKGVRYHRNRPVVKSGQAKIKDPGHPVTIPGVRSYRNTDMREQTTIDEQGFTVDLKTDGKLMTFYGGAVIIQWQVIDPYLYQTRSADPERFVINKVIAAMREVFMSQNDPVMTNTVLSAHCRHKLASRLRSKGIRLNEVELKSGSHETRNITMTDESPADTVTLAEGSHAHLRTA